MVTQIGTLTRNSPLDRDEFDEGVNNQVKAQKSREKNMFLARTNLKAQWLHRETMFLEKMLHRCLTQTKL